MVKSQRVTYWAKFKKMGWLDAYQHSTQIRGDILRILNDESDQRLDKVSVFLTKQEAVQLRGYLNQLLEDPKLQHFHLSNLDCSKEITICIYDEQDFKNFDQRTIRLLKEDL